MTIATCSISLNPSKKTYTPGEPFQVYATFSQNPMVVAEDSVVTLRITFPDGTSASYDWTALNGAVASPSPTLTFPISPPLQAMHFGTHSVRVESSGLVVAVAELEFIADPSPFFSTIPRLITEPIGPGFLGAGIVWDDTNHRWVAGAFSSIVGGTSGQALYNKAGVIDSFTGLTIVAGALAGVAVGGALTTVTKVNAADLLAPVQGTPISGGITITVAGGNNYQISGGPYTIALGTGGSPYVGETITLGCASALAGAVTVNNGGAAGGNIGPSGGTIPSGAKLASDYIWDGSNWLPGGVKRLA